jgi:aminopeptidase N
VLLANAVPLLAVRDAKGWHLPRYTPEGMSFYAVAGSFRVAFDTPRGLDVASTGVVSTRRPLPGGRLEQVVTARRVRDFAFVAGRLERLSADAGGIRVNVWRDPSTPLPVARGALRQAQRSLAFDGRLFGPYPYPYRELDVVIGDYPDFGGQEEPQLVITHPEAPTVAHEVAHQWWYGVVGVDEYAAPWLNEGFASYTQARELGEAASLCQQVSWPEPRDRLGLGMDYWSGRPDEFGAVVYGQGACLLQDLSRTLGRPAFDRLLRQWYVRNRFGNGTTAGFQRLAQVVSGRDLTAFWKRHRLP